MKYHLSFILLFLFLTISWSCKKKSETEVVSPKQMTNEWISLFNGKDLNDWKVKIKGYPLNENIHNTFRVEDGVIKVSYEGYDNFNEAYGHLFYKTPFSSYKLKMQYRFTGNQINGGAGWAERNSGVMLHCQSPESMTLDQDFPISIETQMLGGLKEGENRPTASVCTPGTNVVMNGELITNHCISSNSETYYGDQWVNLEVTVLRDSIITHKINGNEVLSYMSPQIGGNLDEYSSEWQAKSGELLKSGYISLQSESHPVEFRNIELLELDY
jgi:hypothetical protein